MFTDYFNTNARTDSNIRWTEERQTDGQIMDRIDGRQNIGFVDLSAVVASHR